MSFEPWPLTVRLPGSQLPFVLQPDVANPWQDFSALLGKDLIATCCQCFRFAFLSVDLSAVLWIRIWRLFLDPAGSKTFKLDPENHFRSGELRVRNEIEIKLLWQNDDKILQYLIKMINLNIKSFNKNSTNLLSLVMCNLTLARRGYNYCLKILEKLV